MCRAIGKNLALICPKSAWMTLRRGIPPRGLDQLLGPAGLVGWDDLENSMARSCVRTSILDRIGKSNALDRQKLLAFNLDAIQAMTPEISWPDSGTTVKTSIQNSSRKPPRAVCAHCGVQSGAGQNLGRSGSLMPVLCHGRRRHHLAGNQRHPKALAKGEPSGFSRLQDLSVVLSAIESFTASNIEAELQAWADAHAEGNFRAANATCVAVTGGTTSPPLPDTLAILGKASVLRRIERCVASAPDFAS